MGTWLCFYLSCEYACVALWSNLCDKDFQYEYRYVFNRHEWAASLDILDKSRGGSDMLCVYVEHFRCSNA